MATRAEHFRAEEQRSNRKKTKTTPTSARAPKVEPEEEAEASELSPEEGGPPKSKKTAAVRATVRAKREKALTPAAPAKSARKPPAAPKSSSARVPARSSPKR
ncbi:MAG: hypothetical protein U0271_42675 [Polyangiaceae bacterium]